MPSRPRALPSAAAAAAAALLLCSCGELPQPAAQSGGETPYSACAVSDAGGFDDGGLDRSVLDGLESAADRDGVEIRSAEALAEEDYGPSLSAMLQSGCDLTIAAGSPLAEAVDDAAEQHPDRDFALIGDPSLTTPDNVKPVAFDAAEAAFLAGYLAAGVSETGAVGAFGAQDVPEVTEVLDGYSAGVEHWNEENDDDVELLGWDAEEHEGAMIGTGGPEEARAETEALLDDGADVVLAATGREAAGGAAEAVAAAGDADEPLFVGVGEDRYDALPPEQRTHQLTVVVQDVPGAVEQIVADAAEDGLDPAPYVGTLENGGVGLAEQHDQAERVGEDLAGDLDRLRQEIVDGELAVESADPPDRPA